LGSSYSYEPKNRGFDEVFVRGGFVMSQLGYFYGNDHIDATYIHNGKFVHLKSFSQEMINKAEQLKQNFAKRHFHPVLSIYPRTNLWEIEL
tara:strand:+ start:299 stop:571 length:273 start_codon:yes stop_codon:yes gene_type:complete